MADLDKLRKVSEAIFNKVWLSKPFVLVENTDLYQCILHMVRFPGA